MRVWLIQKILAFNEFIFFYPKIKKVYSKITLNITPTIIDVGANKGQSIDFFLSIYPSAVIYAFEPNKILFKNLEIKYALNNNIKIYNEGVSDQDGVLNFNINILDETSTFELINSDSEYLKKKARILGKDPSKLIAETYSTPVITLSKFLLTNEINMVDIIKIDVEGHELSVLNGLFNENLSAKINYIQIENHEDDMYDLNYSKIENILTSNNMEVFKKIKHGFGELYELIFKIK
jgi:FkbM family methyltransferase